MIPKTMMENPQKPKAFYLMGPTAIGKTELSLKLAERIPVEIISVDSAMVYRGLDIGTGKPSVSELAQTPHHLIDIRDPAEPYSAAEFCKDALTAMKQITDRGRIPLLVGGTLLYYKALQQGLSALPSANTDIREKLSKEASALGGWAVMHKRLSIIDPQSAKRIHPNDPQRIQRALEVYEITGFPMSYFFNNDCDNDININIDNKDNQFINKSNDINNDTNLSHNKNKTDEFTNKTIKTIEDYQIICIRLFPEERTDLHHRIETRFQTMIENGLVDEVNQLYKTKNINPSLPAMRAVGYRQVWNYLEGQYSYNQMIEKGIVATRQLAKRQLTWLRNEKSLIRNTDFHDFYLSCSLNQKHKNNHLDLLQIMVNLTNQAGG